MTEPRIHPDLQHQYARVLEIDTHLDRLVKRIELLQYVNPLNTEKEKHRFFASKFTEEPQFKYPKLKFDPYKLHRLFFSHRLDRIEDPVIRDMYKEVIYFYANMVQCIETIGHGKRFYYNSLRVYGTPTEKDVENARFILHFEDEPAFGNMEKRHSPEAARAYFEKFAKQW